MHDKIHSSCPIIRTETMSLMRHVDVDGMGKRDLSHFEREVLWLAESEAEMAFMHGGKVLKTATRFNDFYGYLTSIDQAVEEAQRAAQHYGVDGDSTLEIIVTAYLFERPVLKDTSNEAEELARRGRARLPYIVVPNDWLINDPERTRRWLAAKDWVEKMDIGLPRLDQRQVLAEIVWSSKIEPAQAVRDIEAFKAKHRVACEVVG